MAYSPQLGEAICALLEQNGNLRETCRVLGLTPSTVLDWTKADAAFGEQYAAARARGYEAMADDVVAISDGRAPVVLDDGSQLPRDPVRDRLRADSRKWLLSKVLPKVYGDKVVNEHTGPDGGAIVTEVRRTIVDPKAP